MKFASFSVSFWTAAIVVVTQVCCTAATCTIKYENGSTATVSDGIVVCDSTSECLKAKISGCSKVLCTEQAACKEAEITSSTYVLCSGSTSGSNAACAKSKITAGCLQCKDNGCSSGGNRPTYKSSSTSTEVQTDSANNGECSAYQVTPTTSPGSQTTPTASPGSQTTPTATPGSGTTPTASPGSQTTPTASPGLQTTPTASPGSQTTPTASPGSQSTPTASPGSETTPTASPGSQTTPTASPGSQTTPTASPGSQTTPTASPGTQATPTASPGVRGTPTASPTSDGGGGIACFSAWNTVVVEGKGIVSMNSLQIGDMVKTSATANNGFSRLLSFMHVNQDVEVEYLQIRTEKMNAPLEISRDHYLYVGDSRKIVRAGSVKIGDKLGGSQVVVIESIKRRGLYAPVSESGEIMVSGVSASCYINLLDEVAPFIQATASHAALAPLRIACAWDFSLCENETYSADGFSTNLLDMIVLGLQFVDLSVSMQLMVLLTCLPLLTFAVAVELVWNNRLLLAVVGLTSFSIRKLSGRGRRLAKAKSI